MLEFRTTAPKVAVQADIVTLMSVFDLTALEATLLQAMLVSNSWVGSKEVPDAAASFRQIIFTLRGKMERKHAITIINNGRSKYAIPPGDKEILANAIQKVTQES